MTSKQALTALKRDLLKLLLTHLLQTLPTLQKVLQQSAIQIYTMLVFEGGEMQIKLPVAVLLPPFLSVGEFPGDTHHHRTPFYLILQKKTHKEIYEFKHWNHWNASQATASRLLLLPPFLRTISPPPILQAAKDPDLFRRGRGKVCFPLIDVCRASNSYRMQYVGYRMTTKYTSFLQVPISMLVPPFL